MNGKHIGVSNLKIKPFIKEYICSWLGHKRMMILGDHSFPHRSISADYDERINQIMEEVGWKKTACRRCGEP